MGRNKAQWTTNQHRFVLRVVNQSGHGRWATFNKKTDTWVVLDPVQARDRIKEYNEQTQEPPPFDPVLVNTSKNTWRVVDAPDDENTAPAEQQPRSPLQQIFLAPVIAMMAMGSPSKSTGSPRDPFSSPKQSSSPPRSSAPGGSLTDRVRTSQPPAVPQAHGPLPSRPGCATLSLAAPH